MALFSYSSNPDYPDRYNRTKKWVKILPIAGRHIQTAELTEMQSIIQDNLKQGMNTLFKSGTPVAGLRIAVSSRNNTSLTLSVSRGQIYVEGFVLDVEEATVIVGSSGEYTIGVLVSEKVITEEDDATLRDPLKGGEIYGTPGASRLVWTTSVVLTEDNDQAYAIGKVVDGIISQKEINPFYQIERQLAQYTYERSGHFCVSGYDVSSLGTSRRAISDRDKFTALQTAYDTARSQEQTAIANVVSIQDQLNTVQTGLNQALQTANLSPTAANLARVADLQNREADLQSQYDALTSTVVEKNRLVESARSSLSNTENLLVDKELFSITPGIAYVEGFRVAKADPSLVVVPKDLPETIVDAATFTYQGTASSSLRNYSLQPTTLLNISNNTNQNTLLEIQINRLSNTNLVPPDISPLLTSRFNIKVEYTVTGSNTPLSNALTELVEEVNSTTTIVNSRFKFKILLENGQEIINNTSNQVIAETAKRSILKSYILIQKQGNNSLLFTSANLENREVLEVVCTSKRVNSVTGVTESSGSSIVVDIERAYLAGGQSPGTFQLGFRPVADVIRLVATLEENIKPIIRASTVNGAPGTTDDLGVKTVTRITRVQQGNRVYVEGVDFRLVDQSKIDWSLAGSEPSPGTTYFVNFQYTQPLGLGQDYRLNRDTDSIVFTGRTPAIGTTFSVDYSYYLAKAGVITLDKDGQFSFILSSAAQDPIVPTVPDTVLGIAGFKMYADRTNIIPLQCRRQTVEDINELAERVRTNTRNTEILRLDLDAIRHINSNGEEAIGTFNDPLQDLSKIDLEKSTASVVPAIQALTAGYNQVDVALRHVSGGHIHGNSLTDKMFLTLPFTSVSFLAQPRATQTRDVTVANSSVKKRGKITLSEYTIFDNTGYKGVSPCDALSNRVNAISIQASNTRVTKSIISSVNNLLGATAYRVAESLETGDALTLTNEDSDSYVNKMFSLVKANKFKQIKLKAEGLVPNSGGFKLYFSGKEIKYELNNNTPASMNPIGSIKTKADGTIWLTFNIPEGTICGVHTIELISDTGYAKSRISIYNNLLTQVTLSALKSWGSQPINTNASNFLPLEYSDYVSEDLLRIGIDNSVYPDSIPNITNLELTSAQIYPIRHEVVTQTFTTPEYCYLTQVRLKIRSGPATDAKLKIYLRGAEDLPNKTTYGVAITSEYNFSPFAIEQTIFRFQNPILITRSNKYALSLEAQGGTFKLFTAELGKRDLTDNSILGNQLYLEGDLFTSPDGVSINTYEREDLTYELMRAEFNTTPVIVDLGTYGPNDLREPITYFCINSRDVVPANTEIIYEYSQCASSSECGDWKKFKSNTIVCLPVQANLLKVRATLQTGYSNISPALQIAGATISLYSASESSHIISKEVVYPSAYRRVRMIIQYVKPEGSNINVYYSPTNGNAWEGPEWIEVALQPNSVRVVDQSLNLFEATYYKEENSNYYILSEERRRFRYKIRMTANNKANQALVKNVVTYVI